MAGLIETTTTWMRVWFAYLNMGSENPLMRQQAMQTLRDQGDASLFVLRMGLGRNDQPRIQFGSAVVLHWLGKPAGMQTLLDVIRYREQIRPEMLTHLEAAFLTIGANDSVTALLELWPGLPDWDDTHPYMLLICRLWQSFRDPRALQGLAMRDLRLPRLFEETVASFGVLALPLLRQMTEDRTSSARRLLALATLRRIPGKDSFQLLVPLLRDPDPEVRGQVPEVLEKVSGPIAACRVLTESIRAGYSTHQAVNALWLYRPHDLEETLFTLLSRYGDQKGLNGNDTVHAVAAALPICTTSPASPARILPLLCTLLEPPSDPRIAALASRILVERGVSYFPLLRRMTEEDAFVRNAFWSQLWEMHRESRSEVASALRQFGDPLGEQTLALIEDCRPKGGLLQTLQTMLRGGPDAGQAATKAVQQVTQWFNRLSKETAVRLSGSGPTTDPIVMALNDPRLPHQLRQMLDRALKRLEMVVAPEEIEDVLGICVGLIRAFVRLGAEAIPHAHDPIMRALILVKYNPDAHAMLANEMEIRARAAAEMARESGRDVPVLPLPNVKIDSDFLNYHGIQEVGEMVREAAIAALLQFYGPESLPLLLNALHTPQPHVQLTLMEALGRLGDVRALPALQPFVEGPAPPLAVAAQNAISAIKRTNPEMMTLLRASSVSDARPDTLLRPASGNPETVSPDLLLRPSNPGE